MSKSLNAKFCGIEVSDSEYDHPIGATTAKLLMSELRKKGCEVDSFDNWRDVGWSFQCKLNDAVLEIVLAHSSDSVWMLQVSPVYSPGLIGMLLGKKQSATTDHIFCISNHVHVILSASGFKEFLWRWNGPPDFKHSTHAPAEWRK